MPETLEVLQQVLAGRYRVERELGRGGMAVVYLAEDLKHDRRVAIKVLEPEVASALGAERFLREIKTAARLSHPHILPLHDSGEGGGLLYYVMPYVSGQSLRHRLARGGRLPAEEARRITGQVADALDHAHAHGVVHRDIKPENILLEGTQAIVADFGIAHALAGADAGRLTTVGITVGTPAYMSPEQAVGDAVDGRSDVYALGCVLYELLAGEPPFEGPTGAALVRQHLGAPVPDVTATRPELGAATAAVLRRALAKVPGERFATAGALARALEEAARGVMPAAPASTSEVTAALTAATTERTGGSAGGGTRARRLAIGAAAAALAALAAVAAWQEWWPFGPAEAPRERKDWILVAEFEGPPGDSTLAPAVRSLVSAALDQSHAVATVPREHVQHALSAAGKPPGTPLAPEVARELAYRSSVRAVLEGTVGRLGSGYTVVLQLVDADTARVLFTETATARNDEALIPAMDAVARRLRRGLGEHRAALRATRPMTLVATPSFEAYRLFARAERLQGGGQKLDAIALYRQAIGLDPDFAMAWASLGYCHFLDWAAESSRACLVEALKRPTRLTPVQRLQIEIQRLSLEQQTGEAFAAAENLLRREPGLVGALEANTWVALFDGRYETALEWVRTAMRLSPFGPTDIMRAAEGRVLGYLGRTDEARALVGRLEGWAGITERLNIELAAERYAVAESIATEHMDDRELAAEAFGGTRSWRSWARAGRGSARAAAEDARAVMRALEPAPGTPVGERDASTRNFIARDQLLLSILSNGAIPPPPAAWVADRSGASLVTRCLLAAFTGPRERALRLLDSLRALPEHSLDRRGYAPALLEARLETLAGRPESAIARLRPLSLRGFEPGGPVPVGLGWVNWTLADACEQAGRPDSAAACLERVPSSEGWPRTFVDLRLARLHARLGDPAKAEERLARVERAWDRPDPEVRKLLEEARAVVAEARGAAGPRTP